MAKNAVRLLLDKMPTLRVSLKALQSDVLVGVPQDKTKRKGDGKEPMNNATLAYIHDNGSPAANIPARPFMKPGVEEERTKIATALQTGALGALHGDPSQVERGLTTAGLVAQSSIRAKINTGIEPELAESTLAARRARGRTGTKPLVDTAQMRNAINFVVRKK